MHKVFITCTIATEDQIEKLESLLQTTASNDDHICSQLIDSQNHLGYTPLMCAIDNGYFELAKFLLDKQVNVRLRANTQMKCVTALMLAAKHANSTIATTILLSDKNVDAQDEDGRTALMYACKSRCMSIVATLVHKGANVNLQDNKGRTALMYAVQGATVSTPMVELLLIRGHASMEIKDYRGCTARDYCNDEQLTKLLHKV